MSRRFDRTEERTIRGKKVRFSEKKLKSGETAYYRNGKRAKTSYQKRLAKGVLAGLSVSEARGHPFGAYSGKLLSRREIEAQEEFHLGAWAEPPRAKGRGKEKATYFAKVSVTSESSKKAGSPDGTEEACVARTLTLRDPSQNTQEGFTYREMARNFEAILRHTLTVYRLTPCTGDLREDVISVWRHSRK